MPALAQFLFACLISLGENQCSKSQGCELGRTLVPDGKIEFRVWNHELCPTVCSQTTQCWMKVFRHRRKPLELMWEEQISSAGNRKRFLLETFSQCSQQQHLITYAKSFNILIFFHSVRIEGASKVLTHPSFSPMPSSNASPPAQENCSFSSWSFLLMQLSPCFKNPLCAPVAKNHLPVGSIWLSTLKPPATPANLLSNKLRKVFKGATTTPHRLKGVIEPPVRACDFL